LPFPSSVAAIPQDYIVDPLAEGMWDEMSLLRGPFGNSGVLKVLLVCGRPVSLYRALYTGNHGGTCFYDHHRIIYGNPVA